ncbi:MAG: hypothetical protein NTY35_08620 [Planctomycetota bacterium]|nr:hypothetical protein [Planctomycetota bacterium]
MKTLSSFSFALGATALVAIGSLALRAAEERAATSVERQVGPVRALVLAQPFVLERPAVHTWRTEQPTFDAGYLVVLEVDPAYVQPRQTEEPVLYAGAETLERVNHGATSGRVVCVLPSARVSGGGPALDLSQTTFFFGPEALPERIRATDAQHELERAVRSGARPFPRDEVAAALARGGPLLRLGSRDDLDEIAGVMILDQAPEDQDVGTGLLAPRVR